MTGTSEHPKSGSALETRWLPLVRLEDSKAAAVAIESGIDESTLSKFKQGKPGGKLNAHQVYALFRALGVKVVDSDARCLTKEAFTLLTQCPSIAQKVLKEAPKLLWDEEPS